MRRKEDGDVAGLQLASSDVNGSIEPATSTAAAAAAAARALPSTVRLMY